RTAGSGAMSVFGHSVAAAGVTAKRMATIAPNRPRDLRIDNFLPPGPSIQQVRVAAQADRKVTKTAFRQPESGPQGVRGVQGTASPLLGLAQKRALEGHQLFALLAPQGKTGALQALPQGQPAHRLQLGMIPEHLRQAVIGNPAVEMVDMVDADIAADPAQ